MRLRALVPAIFAPLSLACSTDTAARAEAAPGHAPRAVTTSPAAAPAARDSVVAPARMARPDTVRGLYVNRWAALGRKVWQLLDVARTTEVNTLVIDVKDDRGLALYRSRVPLARAIGADTVHPMSPTRLRTLMDSLRAHGVYTIARIVVAKDPLLAEQRPEWAIMQKGSTEPWRDRAGRPWLDPTHPEVWQYAADLAHEAVQYGFDEVQFDYVRFPDEDRIAREGRYAKLNGRVRAQVIRDQIRYLCELVRPSGVPCTIDVFGLTATDSTDMGIGQRWESFIDAADVVLPMTYPSHYAPGTYELQNPNAQPYATIDQSIKDMKRRSARIAGAAKLVPWYQDFTRGPPRYGPRQVRAQIQAGEDNGIPDWILWNPGSRYSVEAFRPEQR